MRNASFKKLQILFTKSALKKATMIIVVVSIGFGYQNCSNVDFGRDQAAVLADANVEIQGAKADSVYYTSERLIPITIKLKNGLLKQYRSSLVQNMNDADHPWLTISSSVLVDLGNQYAANGEKDGEKVVYLEFRESSESAVVKTSLPLFLDTQVPDLSGTGLIAEGLSTHGIKFSLGEAVRLQFQASDHLAISGQASGLDSQGVRWGLARENDCSESKLFEKSDWLSATNEVTMPWPTADALDTFYVCIFARDRASNTNVYLSQPMTTIWALAAGDNSRGNGVSINSPQVRFKHPYYFTALADGNLVIRDVDFGEWRKIYASHNDSTRRIENFELPLSSNEPIIEDVSGNVFITTGGDVSIVERSKPTVARKVVDLAGSTELAIRRSSLVIGHWEASVKDDSSAEAYLFEIPISTLASTTTPLTLAELKARYKIAGNGFISNSDYTLPTEVVLSASDSADMRYSVGRIISLAVGADGSIFVGTDRQSHSTTGRQSVRRLKPQSGGKYLQTILADYNAAQLSYVKKAMPSGKTVELLLAAGGSECSRLIDLAANTVLNPFTTVGSCRAGIILPDPSGYSFYFSGTLTSQIYHFHADYSFDRVFGRPVLDVIPDAFRSAIGDANGVVEDPDGNIYFVDAQLALIRKVTSEGVMSVVAGKPFDFAAKTNYNGEALADFRLNSVAWSLGWRYQLAADFDVARNRRVLYVGLVQGQIHALDLVSGKVFTLNPIPAGTPENVAMEVWPNDGLTLIKHSNDRNMLLATKRKRIGIDTTYPAYVQQIEVRGATALGQPSIFMGDPSTADMTRNTAMTDNSRVAIEGQVPTVAVDSKGLVFVSGAQFKISNSNSVPLKTRILTNVGSIGTFAVLENGDLRHIIYNASKTLRYITIDTKLLTDVSANPVVKTATALCLPGTTVSGMGQVFVSPDGNLLITDGFQARILRYFVRTADRSLKLIGADCK